MKIQSEEAIKHNGGSRVSLPGYELGIELSWQLQNNGKRGVRLLQEDCYKSVARIRLVKTENPSEFVKETCKV
jgi:hypothetical protein